MAPALIDSLAVQEIDQPVQAKKLAGHKSTIPAPLQLSGALKHEEQFDVTPTIGREFPKANLVEWMNSPDSDALLRDLAILSMCHLPRP